MFLPGRNQTSLPATYTPADLQADWEFKILQSSALAFRKPDVLQKVREEEAQAGWVLLEKIDDGHLRFKRPASARSNDHNLSFDAYRTNYGASMAIRLLIFWLSLIVGAILIYLFFTNRL
ncbi:MAG: hypothetical protein DMF68_15965 [Acidobacteria bacterium]|nr:MAG: hypothetical protein DMF68_15965 [Acidobacteriota bacterium]